MTVSDTQRLVLSRAGRHEARLAAPPTGLPAAARDAVFRSMLKNALLAECAAPREFAGLAWRRDADGAGVALRATDAGLRAIGVDPAEGARAVDTESPAAPHEAPAPPSTPRAGAAPGLAVASGSRIHAMDGADAEDAGDRPRAAADAEPAEMMAPLAPAARGSLRQAAQAVLAAWDDHTAAHAPDPAGALSGAMERLRTLLARSPSAAATAPGSRTLRDGTKRAAVLALLRRPEGASGPQLIEATGWAPHTVRGFLAGLPKKGVAVTVLERVRQAGPGKGGAKGSYTVYRIGADG